MRAAGLLVCGALLLAWPLRALAAPPPEQPDQARASLRGRVVEAGGVRRGVAGAVVLVVDAPADARPGKQPRDPLDPEAVAWMHRVETDVDGEFVLDEVPVGKVRVIVVAGGYARYEQFAEVVARAEPEPLELYLHPEAGEYRTEVRVDREPDYAVEPEHVLDGQEARGYAGSGDDPLLAAQNLPGVARSPIGFGMIGFRGGDPTEAGFISTATRFRGPFTCCRSPACSRRPWSPACSSARATTRPPTAASVAGSWRSRVGPGLAKASTGRRTSISSTSARPSRVRSAMARSTSGLGAATSATCFG